MSDDAPVLEFQGVEKAYQALRPLRLAELRIAPGAVVSVGGIDAPGAEVLVNLLTAAVRPDAGTVRLFGVSTDAVADYDAWLAMLDGLGLLTERAVLLEQCTVAQNVALPLTLEIDPIPAAVRLQVAALADEVGIAAEWRDRSVRDVPPGTVQRVRLARALALGPRLLVAEHPSAPLPRPDVVPFARDLAAIAARRRLAVLAVSADREFVRALGGTALTLEPATGALTKPGLLARLGLGESSMAIRGTVVRLEPAHDFGFIRDDCGGEWFFVAGGVRTRALDTLWLDERVLFEQEWTPGGPRATDVRNEYAA